MLNMPWKGHLITNLLFYDWIPTDNDTPPIVFHTALTWIQTFMERQANALYGKNMGIKRFRILLEIIHIALF